MIHDVRAPRILRLPEVRSRTGMSRSSIYLAIQRGEFPLQVQLTTRSVGWREEEINLWVEARLPCSKAGAV